ncbi:aldehyde dehydrogenase [Sphingorhabdus sp. 109]|jgi:acyl-CoA reductase-like NAD-dependent aldehyde dehydrogenase|uniref:aldehyde dehydrogenase n=1 Tax=Sphingorhabdus sp. 109 TaxID=2653173 RepID=UPI0012F4607F|nr:aldehyde dehydrogenase [Sphingorhabdus sp. 109]VWX60179.1 5-carboxymethyl-2-hydroxymuconate semialdehyde dehydrogenase [Sphingorhabdus sp. 109]
MITAPTAIIDGEAIAGSGAPISVIDPATEEVIAGFPDAEDALVDRAVTSARAAFERGEWRNMSVAERQKILRNCADAIDAAADEIADLECANTGIPYSQVRGRQVGRSADNFRFFADYIGQMTAELYEQDPNYLTFVRREPVGVAALISPWNSPITLGSMKVASAIAFGNSCVLKPAEQAPLALSKLVEIIQSAGLPEGVLNLVNGNGATAGDRLVRHPDIDCISFTGGTETGRRIMTAAGENLKPTIMELGGKSANIIFEDADFEQALDGALIGIFTNNGQQCLAGSRILVQRGIAKRFIEAFVERAKAIRVGSPRDASTEVGPLASGRHYEHVMSFVPEASNNGANLLAGGKRAAAFDKGFYFEPTIALVESNDHRLCQDEIFGPFASVQIFDTAEEAYAIANRSRFGLVGYVWSQNIATVMEAQAKISAGTVWCNTPMMRELRAPFGGFRESGVGAEGGRAAEAFYMHQKTVSMPCKPLTLTKLGKG